MSKLDRAIEKFNQAVTEMDEIMRVNSAVGSPGFQPRISVWSMCDLDQVPGVATFEKTKESSGFAAIASKVHKGMLFTCHLTTKEYENVLASSGAA